MCENMHTDTRKHNLTLAAIFVGEGGAGRLYYVSCSILVFLDSTVHLKVFYSNKSIMLLCYVLCCFIQQAYT